MTKKIKSWKSGIFHYHSPQHVRNEFTMIQRILQLLQYILPSNQFDGIFFIFEKIGNLASIDEISFTFIALDLMRCI